MESQSTSARSTEKVLKRLEAPETSSIPDFGTDKSFERNKMRARFAFPSVAGAAIRIHNWPSSLRPIAEDLALGFTRKATLIMAKKNPVYAGLRIVKKHYYNRTISKPAFLKV